jgi:hypothetical protein
MDPVHTFLSYFYTSRFNIIPPSASRLSYRHSSFRRSYQSPLTTYSTCLAHHIWHDFKLLIFFRRVQIMKTIFMRFPSACVILFLSRLFSCILSRFSSRNVRFHVSVILKVAGKIAVLCIFAFASTDRREEKRLSSNCIFITIFKILRCTRLRAVKRLVFLELIGFSRLRY